MNNDFVEEFISLYKKKNKNINDFLLNESVELMNKFKIEDNSLKWATSMQEIIERLKIKNSLLNSKVNSVLKKEFGW